MPGGTPICVHISCICSVVIGAGADGARLGEEGGKPKESTLRRTALSTLLRGCLWAGSCSIAKLERPLVCSECADSVLPRPVGVAALRLPPKAPLLLRSPASAELRRPLASADLRSKALELRLPPGAEPVLMLMLRLLPAPCAIAESWLGRASACAGAQANLTAMQTLRFDN